jgi:hypothetical protein
MIYKKYKKSKYSVSQSNCTRYTKMGTGWMCIKTFYIPPRKLNITWTAVQEEFISINCIHTDKENQ